MSIDGELVDSSHHFPHQESDSRVRQGSSHGAPRARDRPHRGSRSSHALGSSAHLVRG